MRKNAGAGTLSRSLIGGCSRPGTPCSDAWRIVELTNDLQAFSVWFRSFRGRLSRVAPSCARNARIIQPGFAEN